MPEAKALRPKRQERRVESDSKSAKEGWETLDSDCVVAYAIGDPMVTGGTRDRRSAAMSDTLPAYEDVEYVADTAAGTP